MNLGLGFIMFLCLAPFLVIAYFYLYPKNWQKRKFVFGIKVRQEYKMGDVERRVDEIVQRNRNTAKWIITILIIIGLGLLLISNLTAMMIIFTFFILIAFVICDIPYIKGNSELKSLKRELGIESKGVIVADLKSISSAHAISMPMLLIPNLIAVLCTVFALLYDLKVIKLFESNIQGSFSTTILTGSFMIMGFSFIIAAKMMDNMRNEVISEESEVNVNFNRAKKKTWSDFWVQMCWVNTAMIIVFMIINFVGWSELGAIIISIAYMIAICVIIGLLTYKTALLNEVYKYEGSGYDDDDNWIYGLFYYNPKDGRVNIERRDGMGTTINMAHPIGKIITAIVALVIIGSIASLIWVGAMEATAIDVRFEENKVICHHLNDEYIIPRDEILDITMDSNIENLNPVRIAGVNSDNLLKGRWTVGEDKNARLFMNPDVDLYIRIETEEYVYYINDNSEEETREIYDKVLGD